MKQMTVIALMTRSCVPYSHSGPHTYSNAETMHAMLVLECMHFRCTRAVAYTQGAVTPHTQQLTAHRPSEGRRAVQLVQ